MMHQIKTSAAADATASLDAAKMHFVQGIKHYEAGKFDKAQVSFEASLACFPGRVSTLGNLEATLVKLGQPAAALPMAFDAPAYPAVNFQTVQPIRCLGGGYRGFGRKKDCLGFNISSQVVHRQQLRRWVATDRALAKNTNAMPD